MPTIRLAPLAHSVPPDIIKRGECPEFTEGQNFQKNMFKNHKTILTKKRVLLGLLVVIILFFCANTGLNYASAQTVDLAQPIGDLELSDADIIQEGQTIKVYWLAKYIKALYKYGIYIVGILALIMIMVGGLFWVTAAGNPNNIATAKKIIGGAISGLILGLLSYLLLLTINPALVELRPIEIQLIAPIVRWCEELKEGFYIIDPDHGECGDTAKILVKRDDSGSEVKTDSGGICYFRGNCGSSKICEFYKDEEGIPVKEPKCLEPVEFCDTASTSYACATKAPFNEIKERGGWACIWYLGEYSEISTCALLRINECKDITQCSEYFSPPPSIEYFYKNRANPKDPHIGEFQKTDTGQIGYWPEKICNNDYCGKGCVAGPWWNPTANCVEKK